MYYDSYLKYAIFLDLTNENKVFRLPQNILSKKPSAEKSSPQMVADQEMLRPKWWQIKKLVRPTYSFLFVRLQN